MAFNKSFLWQCRPPDCMFPNKTNLINMLACELVIFLLLNANLWFAFILSNTISKALQCLKGPFHLHNYSLAGFRERG